MLFKEKRKDANNHGIWNLHANIKASHSQASPVLPSSQKEKGRVQTVKDLVLHNTPGGQFLLLPICEYFSVAGTWPVYRQGTQKGHHCLLTSCQKTGSLNYFSLHVLEGKRRKVWGLAVRRCLWAAPCGQHPVSSSWLCLQPSTRPWAAAHVAAPRGSVPCVSAPCCQHGIHLNYWGSSSLAEFGAVSVENSTRVFTLRVFRFSTLVGKLFLCSVSAARLWFLMYAESIPIHFRDYYSNKGFYKGWSHTNNGRSEPGTEQKYRPRNTGEMGNAGEGPVTLNGKDRMIKSAATKEVLLPPITNFSRLGTTAV